MSEVDTLTVPWYSSHYTGSNDNRTSDRLREPQVPKNGKSLASYRDFSNNFDMHDLAHPP